MWKINQVCYVRFNFKTFLMRLEKLLIFHDSQIHYINHILFQYVEQFLVHMLQNSSFLKKKQVNNNR